jgi:hypothetical protein
MPVKDALPYLDEAVESILGQTFGDFEFVILDDGSQDGSRARLREWAASDTRIRLLESDRSLGPVGSSNRVVAAARAPLVARMDADDVAHPDRLARQVELMRRNPDAVLAGSTWEGIDADGRVVREPDRSTLGGSGFAAPIAHGSILFRRAAFEAVGGYRLECAFWEDLDLFVRMAAIGRILVSAEPLYRYRFSPTSTRLTSRRDSVEEAVDAMFCCRRAFERGERYAPRAWAKRTGRLQPETFTSIGSVGLWAGVRPGSLQRLVARGALRVDAATFKALAWATLAEASPRGLRRLMRLLLAWRNRRSRVSPIGIFEWRPQPGLRLSDSAAALGGSNAGPVRSGAARPSSARVGARES